MLYFPASMCHSVETIEEGISINISLMSVNYASLVSSAIHPFWSKRTPGAKALLTALVFVDQLMRPKPYMVKFSNYRSLFNHLLMIMVKIPFCHLYCDDLQRSHKHKISKASFRFYPVSTSLDLSKLVAIQCPLDVRIFYKLVLEESRNIYESHRCFKIWIHYYLNLLWWFEKLQISCHVTSQKMVCWVSSELYVFIISYPSTASMQLK